MKKRFKILNKRTILDTKTGLEWERAANGPMTWQAAMDYATAKGKGWRLPTIEELITLINFSKYDPASDFPGMSPYWLWSSSSYAYDVSYAWLVNFNNGAMDGYGKSATSYVRCVRSGL
jgi:hypothetical protein